MRRLIALCGPVAMGAALLASTAATSASGLACGQTVTRSVTLGADLRGCAGTGLIVGADDIVIDLNGHSISGRNRPGSEGIADDGHAGVTVLDGAIRGFRVNGVGLRDAPGSTVRGLRISAIGEGGVDGEPSAGILVRDSGESRVIDNVVSNDVDAFQSDGVDVIGSEDVLVQGNRLTRNAWNGLAFILSPGGRIVDNEFSRSANQGAEVNSSESPVVRGNRAFGNAQFGLVVGAMGGARVSANTLRDNVEGGALFFDVHDSRVLANEASGNGVGIDFFGGQFGSTGNRLEGNRTHDNDFIGIVVHDGADGNLIVGNVASRNRGTEELDSGILVDSATGNTLTRNVADLNAGNGIYAGPGSIDGGGNSAVGNRGEQCIGVAC